eukprot:COSAG02_NODE_5997_length_3885_cov_1.450872_5_plen_63_part_01
MRIEKMAPLARWSQRRVVRGRSLLHTTRSSAGTNEVELNLRLNTAAQHHLIPGMCGDMPGGGG